MFSFQKGLCPLECKFVCLFVVWLDSVCKYFKCFVMASDDLGVAFRRQQTEFMCRHASVEKRLFVRKATVRGSMRWKSGLKRCSALSSVSLRASQFIGS